MSSIFVEPKIDCHCHILDPTRFAYNPAARFHPAGQEIGTAGLLDYVLAVYGVRYALLVQPNSGYEDDNRCMLDSIARNNGRFKGIAIVAHDISLAGLMDLQSAGVVGVAFNLPFHSVEYYLDTAPLLEKLIELGMFLQIQVQDAQLLGILPLIERVPVRLLIDHSGRPSPEYPVKQPGFQALLALGRSGRAAIKLSGYGKFSRESYPFSDTLPFIRALVDAFTPQKCLWGSDWPFLRATARVDYGPLLTLFEDMVPDAADRKAIFWDTPRRLLGFGSF
jgi:predicted TIM-barrel fold metal-dependent hydrolase